MICLRGVFRIGKDGVVNEREEFDRAGLGEKYSKMIWDAAHKYCVIWCSNK